MKEITPKELEGLKELGRKIANGQKLEEVTVTIETEIGPQQLTFRDPDNLAVLAKAAMEVHRRYLGEPGPEKS